MIRQAEDQDAKEITEIINTSLGYSCTEELVAEKLKCVNKDREVVFVSVTEGKVNGFIHVEKYDTLYLETLCNVLGLAVANSAKRRGIGSALIQEAEEWARSNEIYAMRLNSGGKRSEAHIFYQNLGYEDVKEQLRFMKKL